MARAEKIMDGFKLYPFAIKMLQNAYSLWACRDAFCVTKDSNGSQGNDAFVVHLPLSTVINGSLRGRSQRLTPVLS